MYVYMNEQNAGGIWYSFEYGFGRINAGNAVSLAKVWDGAGNLTGTSTPVINVNYALPNPSSTLFNSTCTIIYAADVPVYIEHVMVMLVIISCLHATFNH
jgi:hypothetical protein